MKRVDYGTRCVICGHGTDFGSGRFVNRIPADIVVGDEVRVGMMCEECQTLDVEPTKRIAEERKQVLYDAIVGGMCPLCHIAAFFDERPPDHEWTYRCIGE